MKNITILASIICGAFITGCGSNETAAPTTDPAAKAPATTTVVAYDIGTKKKGDKGICVICNAKEGMTAEEDVKETVDYQGKTYLFCSESEKADFIADPTKYAKK